MPSKIPPPSLPDKGKTITFHRFPHHIWHDQNLSLHERVVLCRVWSFLPRRCYLSYAQWAKELGCHRVTAVDILNRLVTKKKLTKSLAPEGSNEWHLVVSDYHLDSEDDIASSPTLLPLVVTDYPPSSPTLPVLVVTDYPRRSLEDQLKDHKEDQTVADAPTPTYDLVTHGDYPCHLRGLPSETLAESATPPSRICHPPTQTVLPPLAESATNKNNYKINNKIIDKNTVADAPTPTYKFSLTLEEAQDSEVPLESESVKEPIEVSEAPPIPAAPPKKRKEPSGRKVAFPSPEYWASVRPDLIDWAKKRGALGTDEEIGRWVDERLEKLEGAAISKDMKYSSWYQTFQTFYQHLIPTQLKKAFDGLVLAANEKNRFHDIWDKAPSAKKFGFEAEGVEAYRYRLKNFDEDSRDGGTLLKQFIKTVNAK